MMNGRAHALPFSFERISEWLIQGAHVVGNAGYRVAPDRRPQRYLRYDQRGRRRLSSFSRYAQFRNTDEAEAVFAKLIMRVSCRTSVSCWRQNDCSQQDRDVLHYARSEPKSSLQTRPKTAPTDSSGGSHLESYPVQER